MKFIHFIILIFFSCFFIFLSCSNQLVKATVWSGTIEIDDKKYDLEAYFKSDYTMKVYIELPGNNGKSMSGEGSYNISSNYKFYSKVRGEADIDNDGSKDPFKIEFSGILNFYTGAGDGDYEETVRYTGGAGDEDTDCEWELKKINSY